MSAADSPTPAPGLGPVVSTVSPAPLVPFAEVARRAADDAAARLVGVEFASWRCGTELPASMRNATEFESDVYRRELSKCLAPLLLAAFPGTSRRTNDADVLIDAIPDGRGGRFSKTRIAPLYVAGRYRKLSRDLSQTRFLCRDCRGRRRAVPCPACGGTGLAVPASVEGFVRPAVARAARGRGSSFHGSGREDVDVRMLGRGRPFVVSVDAPRLRTISFAAIESEVAERSQRRVEVTELAVVDRATMRQITAGHGPKTYLVVAETPGADAPLPEDAGARLASLTGAVIAQRTPVRVAKRRADLVRERRVLAVRVIEIGPLRAVVEIETDPGTYVKEIVSGDAGRTEPSFTSVLGVPCRCTELDVLAAGTRTGGV